MKPKLIALILWLSLGCSQADPALFVGTFVGKEVTLTLGLPVDGKLKGLIKLGTANASFPAVAVIRRDELLGKFKSGGELFDFSVALKGKKYWLSSGGRTYALSKDDTANPLKASAASESTDAAPPPSTAASDVMDASTATAVVPPKQKDEKSTNNKTTKSAQVGLAGTYTGKVSGVVMNVRLAVDGESVTGTMDSNDYIYVLRGVASGLRVKGTIRDTEGGESDFQATVSGDVLKIETEDGAFSFRRSGKTGKP